MKVVIVDVDAFAPKEIEDLDWILKEFKGNQIIWVFKDTPFATDEDIEFKLRQIGFPTFRVFDPISFITALMEMPIWYEVQGFDLCVKDNRLVFYLGSGVDRIFYSDNEYVDAGYYKLEGIPVEKILDYYVLSEALGDDYENQILKFLNKYEIADIQRYELVRDDVRDIGLGVLLENNFFKTLLYRVENLKIIPDLCGLSEAEIIQGIYGVSGKNIDERVLRWQFEGRKVLILKCSSCNDKINISKSNPVVDFKGPSRLIIVGEAPGEREVELGKPFIGKSGEILEGWISILGFKKEDFWMTNAVLCRSYAGGWSIVPPPEMLQLCRWRLLAEIQNCIGIFGSIFLWILGSTANSGLFDIDEGKYGIYEYPFGIVLYTPHPGSFLHRNGPQEQLKVIELIKEAKSKLIQIGWLKGDVRL